MRVSGVRSRRKRGRVIVVIIGFLRVERRGFRVGLFGVERGRVVIRCLGRLLALRERRGVVLRLLEGRSFLRFERTGVVFRLFRLLHLRHLVVSVVLRVLVVVDGCRCWIVLRLSALARGLLVS